VEFAYAVVPGSSDIIKVLDASFSLHYVKSRSGDLPSALLMRADENTRKQLKHLERVLLHTQELFEMLGKLAGIVPENLHDLGPRACGMSLDSARQYFDTREALGRDDVHANCQEDPPHAGESPEDHHGEL
jgi:hypothetical protein